MLDNKEKLTESDAQKHSGWISVNEDCFQNLQGGLHESKGVCLLTTGGMYLLERKLSLDIRKHWCWTRWERTRIKFDKKLRKWLRAHKKAHWSVPVASKVCSVEFSHKKKYIVKCEVHGAEEVTLRFHGTSAKNLLLVFCSFCGGSGGHLVNGMDRALKLLPDCFVHHSLPIYGRLSLEGCWNDINAARWKRREVNTVALHDKWNFKKGQFHNIHTMNA